MGCLWPRVAVSAAQHKIVNLLKTFSFAHHFLLVFVYLMCGPRQLSFFPCGRGTPKRLDTPERLSLFGVTSRSITLLEISAGRRAEWTEVWRRKATLVFVCLSDLLGSGLLKNQMDTTMPTLSALYLLTTQGD